MKTNNLQKKSVLTSLILLATAAYHGLREKVSYSEKTDPSKMQRMVGDHVFGGFRARNLAAIYIPRHGKLKGWMRENRKYRTNKTK